MKPLTWIDQCKLRLGIGTTGQSSIDPYTTKGILTPLYYTWGATTDVGYVLSDATLASPSALPNKKLSWEYTTQRNIGFQCIQRQN